MFLIERSYYMKTSAIEIFTYEPYKSYYFNFKDKFKFDKIENNENFHKIKHKNIILYYNNYYSPMLFPFIKKQKLNLYQMSKFYNNYDLLTIINILANRSFKDLYQYPVFPLLYKHTGIVFKSPNIHERDMSQHIGLQEFKDTKDLTISSYLSDTNDENEFDKIKHLFNTYFSCSTYVANYLIRIFPYTLVSVEMQGTYFDAPDRLFTCIKAGAKNTIAQKSDNREYIPELYYLPDIFINRNEFFFGTTTSGKVINNIDIYGDKHENNYIKYEFSAKIKNQLEFDNLDINNWIDLFFGVKQKYYDYKKNILSTEQLDYYPEYMYLDYYKTNEISSLDLDNLEFGMMPYQIYYNKSNSIQEKSKLYKIIKDFNEKQFALEHKVLNNHMILDNCFQCFGSDNINYGYYYIIKNKKYGEASDTKMFAELDYFKSKESDIKNKFFKFIGNNLGNITIEIKDEIKEEGKNIINLEVNKKVEKVILRDHTEAIKYIDYNKRLNMFLSYSSDGFINIYCFPSCKLVRSIKVSEFTKELLEVVILVSNPYPMIFTCDKDKMFIISINGVLIKEKEILEVFPYSERKIIPSIDKDFGIVNDYICFSNEKKSNKGGEKKIETIRIEIELPSLERFEERKDEKNKK